MLSFSVYGPCWRDSRRRERSSKVEPRAELGLASVTSPSLSLRDRWEVRWGLPALSAEEDTRVHPVAVSFLTLAFTLKSISSYIAARGWSSNDSDKFPPHLREGPSLAVSRGKSSPAPGRQVARQEDYELVPGRV